MKIANICYMNKDIDVIPTEEEAWDDIMSSLASQGPTGWHNEIISNCPLNAFVGVITGVGGTYTEDDIEGDTDLALVFSC